MLPTIALSLALLTPQATPAPPPNDSPPAQPPQPQSSATAPKQPAARLPCHAPDASGLYNNVCGVTLPRLLHHVDPQYSQEARQQKISGDVIMKLTVDADGNPLDVRVLRSLADTIDPKHRVAAQSLDQKALDAVNQYKFAPATYEGKPVPIEINMQITFQIH